MPISRTNSFPILALFSFSSAVATLTASSYSPRNVALVCIAQACASIKYTQFTVLKASYNFRSSVASSTNGLAKLSCEREPKQQWAHHVGERVRAGRLEVVAAP